MYASLQSRLFAKFTDLLIVVFLGLLLRGGVGSLLGFFYSLVADGVPLRGFRGQSLGKKILGIQVVDSSGRPASLRVSVIRNIPVGLVTLFMVLPPWGWFLSVLVGIPLFLVESSLMVRAKARQRLGDVMAESFVIRIQEEP